MRSATPLLDSRLPAARPARGFTLIELLVVVGIIAVLLSILLPMVSRVHESARAAQCASNMRQVGNALLLYVADNQGAYPLKVQRLSTGASSGATVYSWVGQAGTANSGYAALTAIDRPLNKYLGNFKPNSPVPVAACPNDTRYSPQSSYDLYGSSYSSNTGGLLNTSLPTGTDNFCIPARSVLHPARFILMVEQCGGNFVSQPAGSYSAQFFYVHYSKASSTTGQWNVLYGDFHVAAPIMSIYNGIPDHNANADALEAMAITLGISTAYPYCTNCEGPDYSCLND